MKKTEIIVIADESGSMGPLTKDANGSFDSFVKEQREVEGEARLTLVKFSSGPDSPRKIYQALDIQKAEGLNLNANGMTALYDAIGVTITQQASRIALEKWADLVVVVILTDGEENYSKEYTLDAIKALTAVQEANGWKFIYLMSNQDAFAAAQRMGSSGAHAMSHAASSKGTQDSYAFASARTRSFRSVDPADFPLDQDKDKQ